MAAFAVAASLFGVVPHAVAQTPANATLSSIMVGNAAVPDFDAEQETWQFGVENSVSTATVTATTTDSAASVACGTDTDTNAAGCQVGLTAGQSTDLTLTVTNGMATKTYTLKLNRGASGQKQWKASDDIYGLAAQVNSVNANLLGSALWSDGSTLYAANISPDNGDDGHRSRVYAFNRSTGAREPQNDAAVGDHSLPRPNGIAGNLDQELFVASGQETAGSVTSSIIERGDQDEWTVYVPVGWDANAVFNPNTEGHLSRDLWLETDNLWVVVDKADARHLAAFDRGSDLYHWNARNDLNCTLAAGNAEPTGVWSDGETFFVADKNVGSEGVQIWAYDRSTCTRDTNRQFLQSDLQVNGANIDNIWGIWSDGRTMWVMDQDSGNIYSYNMPVSTNTELSHLTVVHAEKVELDVSERAHTVRAAPDATSATLSLATRNYGASFEVTPDDSDNNASNGHQVDLTSGTVDVTITVRAVSGRTENYTVTIGQEPPEIGGVSLVSNTNLLLVGWAQPQNPGTLGIESYDLRYARTSASNLDRPENWTVVPGVWNSGDGPLSYLLTGLNNDVEYYVQVWAVNSFSPGPWPAHSSLSSSARGTPALSAALDARATSITVNGAPIPEYDLAVGTYTVGVAPDVAIAEVVVVPEDAGATVGCTPDDDPNTEGCQVALTADAGTDVSVVLRDGTDFGNYKITINRGRSGAKQWKASLDIYDYPSRLTTFNRPPGAPRHRRHAVGGVPA